jgi:hypothetical protein
MLVLATGGIGRTLLIGVPFWLGVVFLGFLLWPVFQYFPTLELIAIAFLVLLTFGFLRGGKPRRAALSAAVMLAIGLHGYTQFHAAKSFADLEAQTDFVAAFEITVARDAHFSDVNPEVWRGGEMERALKSLNGYLGRDINTSSSPARSVWTSGKLYADQECEDVREWSYMLHEPGVAHRKFHFDTDRMAAQPKAVKDTVLLERARFPSGLWANCFNQISW